MTEYDYSEEGYQRYMQTLNRVSDWVDGTNAARSRYAHAVHPPTQSTPSQVATRSRTRERSQSASYSYPQHAYHSQQNLHHPYDGGGARAGPQGAPPPRMQPTRSKTMDVSVGSHLQYTHRHVYDKQPQSQTQPQTQTHTRSGSRSSSRHPSPPNNSSHVSSHTTTPHHSRSASRVTSPVSASTTARQQFPPAQPYKPPPQTQQTQARHVRSSSAEPTAIRTRSRSYSYSGPSPAPHPAPTPRPIPVPQPVSAVLPRREPRRSNTMPPGHHHHVYDHTGKERNVLRKSYDYVPGVGVGTGMTRGGTYVAVPPGYSARVMDVRSTTPSKQPPHRPLLKRIFTSFKN